MLTESQIQREANRRRISLVKAARWRIHAIEVRDRAAHMRGQHASEAMLMIASDFDFLAEYEERQRWPGL